MFVYLRKNREYFMRIISVFLVVCVHVHVRVLVRVWVHVQGIDETQPPARAQEFSVLLLYVFGFPWLAVMEWVSDGGKTSAYRQGKKGENTAEEVA